tara:strand:- start:258 stop:380 length:123 start_codon:yes stop_codon:yes gene_type:complete
MKRLNAFGVKIVIIMMVAEHAIIVFVYRIATRDEDLNHLL